MTRLPRISGQDIVSALERGGYRLVRTRGSHHYLRGSGREVLVTVPVHGPRTVPAGTLSAILRQAGLTVDDFLQLLES